MIDATGDIIQAIEYLQLEVARTNDLLVKQNAILDKHTKMFDQIDAGVMLVQGEVHEAGKKH